MFCNQCEQTAKGTGCTAVGVCEKNESIANLQNALMYALRALSSTALKARTQGIINETVDRFTAHAMFMTLTNVNFDETVLTEALHSAILLRKELAQELGCKPTITKENIAKKASEILALNASPNKLGNDVDTTSAMQILFYGAKGLAAYIDHASVLGESDTELYTFLHKALETNFVDMTTPHKNEEKVFKSLPELVDLIMECGKVNLRAMELLEKGNTKAYGTPVPTQVSLGHKKGKAILVSGHDLKDLYNLLKATENTGINIYTHGEMLPAHGYPKLHAFKHLAGHYGTAWQNQKKEMPLFPGAILFTTNCIQNPEGYNDKVFTTGAVAFPNTVHCPNDDFSLVIKKALELEGFTEDAPAKVVTTGFGRESVLAAAPALLAAIKEEKVKHIFLVGGCDGAKTGRNYYTEFVEKAPKDTIILTLACGKFRFFDKDLGTVAGLPRLIDMGQCNDAYGAIQVAVALAEACNCSVNDLPLTLVLSWYEQKAVVILLTLLSLGIKNIYIGPSLPAFISPNILDLLVTTYNLTPISTVDADLKTILG